MADIFYDVDTALAEVPVNIMPLVDKATFIAIQDAVAYNAGGMALRWHFVTTAGAYTVTSVTPTLAGVHDWTDQGDSGIYTIEIPASGGTINNDTEGFGWFTGSTTAVCPWRSPVYGFRAAAINDALIDGGDLLDVSVTQFNGTAATAASGRPEVNATHIDGVTAENLRRAFANMTIVTATGTPTSTTLTNATLSSSTNDKYKGRPLYYLTGNLAGEIVEVTAYNGTSKTLTHTASPSGLSATAGDLALLA